MRIFLKRGILAFMGMAVVAQAAPSMQQQLQKLTGGNKQQALGQAVVIGMLLGCSEKQVGKENIQLFYNEMNQVGKVAEGYCKAGQPTQARQLLLDTFQAKHNDPVVLSVLNCYDAQSGTIAGMGGQQMATDMAHYSRWVRDPAVASQEMKETDICRK